jgi:hypothetical protein
MASTHVDKGGRRGKRSIIKTSQVNTEIVITISTRKGELNIIFIVSPECELCGADFSGITDSSLIKFFMAASHFYKYGLLTLTHLPILSIFSNNYNGTLRPYMTC